MSFMDHRRDTVQSNTATETPTDLTGPTPKEQRKDE
eukprot:CAMPEP_0181184666 /NCGR_PEP_ID=MMETSP1096-20121128/9091_1 /TAXON_ID=156174 ORGANISM="Chrysochromulina ericina, Strain CCMP281" /NCGR_SAMPLE_ID=MMETSP1096 /ASSEMBLY_ACC=CAM_ASM_000453 /LENGTH=35 /DNA_ID= /DNA_START= /DNA_END= /DNA_ORIENTATION=